MTGKMKIIIVGYTLITRGAADAWEIL